MAKKSTPPSLYTIFNPNSLINAKKPGLSLAEYRAYHEILNYNHKDNPEQLVYKVSYHHVLDFTDKVNLSTNKKRVADSLQKRSFWFDKKFVEKYFNERKEYSIVPFPKVIFDDDNLCFEIKLQEDFKKILTMLEDGFTKGDIQTLRGFEHQISNAFYWVLRQKQTFKGTWETTFEELKILLDLKEKYKAWKDFKLRVLDVALEDMNGTWTEFKYTLEQGGRGNAIKNITFKFTYGNESNVDSKPLGHHFAWEKALIDAGLKNNSIMKFRIRVMNTEATIGKDGVTIIWDSLYITSCIESAHNQWEKYNKNNPKKQLKNPAAFLYEGIENGWWISEINKEKELVSRAVQQTLDF